MEALGGYDLISKGTARDDRPVPFAPYRKAPTPALHSTGSLKMKWNIKELENAVREEYGDKSADALQGPLQSFGWKSEMAYYHACETEKILKEAISTTTVISDNDPPAIAYSKAAMIAAFPDESGQELRFSQLKAEAHIIASAQAVHSLCDIISHIVYYSYNLDNLSPPALKDRLNLHRVLKTLDQLPHHSNTASLVRSALQATEFKYMTAYVNTTKHRSLVSATFSASFGEENRGGMRIKAFTYEDPYDGTHRHYERKWAYDFLFPENHSLKQKLMAVGNSLNDFFR